jgi:hypothetical protein
MDSSGTRKVLVKTEIIFQISLTARDILTSRVTARFSRTNVLLGVRLIVSRNLTSA